MTDMTKGKILVTDSLFISDKEVSLINKKGYEVVRLDKLAATEDELCEAIAGKVGYILGGIERVTGKVIESADKLKVISFTGSGYSEFIPAHELATKNGIAITAATGANASAVAEFAITEILMSTRRISSLTLKDGLSFSTTKSADESKLGIVGFGNIGMLVAEKAHLLGYDVLVCDRPSINKADYPNYEFMSLETLVSSCDVISLHVDKLNGEGVITSSLLESMNDGTTVINTAYPEAIDIKALSSKLDEKKLYATFDAPCELNPNDYEVGRLLQSNAQTGFNTESAIKNVNNITTTSLLNILESNFDSYQVNSK